jgi:hypothetical protein
MCSYHRITFPHAMGSSIFADTSRRRARLLSNLSNRCLRLGIDGKR